MHKQHHILLYSLCFCLFFIPVNSNAQSLINKFTNSALLNSVKKPKLFVYLQNSYFWNINSKYANTITKLGFGGRGKYKKLNFNQELFYSAYEDTFYLKAQELFLDYRPWFIGQKKHLWSWADLLWDNNLWQAEFYQNPTQAVSMGLLGLHWEKKYNKWSYYIFFSPVFLPRYSSKLNAEATTIKSFSPWLQSVPTKFNDLDIEYQIDKFSALKLVAKNSIAFQFKYNLSSSLFISSALSYKPSNFIFIGLKPVVVSAANKDILKVNIKPYTAQESLATIETGIKKPFWSLLFSSSYRAYTKKKVNEPGYFFDKLSNAFLYNLYYSIKNNKGYSVFISYQKVVGYKKESYYEYVDDEQVDNEYIEHEYIELQETLFSYPYNYLEAVRLGVDINNLFNISSIDYKIHTIYGVKQKAFILVSCLMWKPKPQIKVLLNVTNFYKNPSVASNSNFFLHKFSKNNFIQMGVTYVF